MSTSKVKTFYMKDSFLVFSPAGGRVDGIPWFVDDEGIIEHPVVNPAWEAAVDTHHGF